jgi:hypothetical protein
MVFLADDDKLLDDQQQQGQGQGQQQMSGGQSVVGQSGGDVGSGNSLAGGVGAGGQGGFTNIQAYLKANEGDTGSANALTNTVQGQFNKEKDQFTQDSTNFLGNAQKQVNDQKIDNTKADQLIGQAKDNYSWSQKSDPYMNTVNQVQNALTSQYSGPKEYNYGFSNDTQTYGTGLKDNQGFDSLMNNVYSKSAGKPLTSGQFQLQKQFDVNNVNLNKARENLANQYGELEKERDNTVSNTTKGLGDLEQQYRNNQTSLKDYLYGKSTAYDKEVADAEAQARDSYQAQRMQGTGMKSAGYDGISDWASQGGVNRELGNSYMNKRRGMGIWGDNLTFDQLEREKSYLEGAYGRQINNPNYRSSGRWDPKSEYQSRVPVLNNFYSQVDQQFANTGDEQERSFNAILDMLNSDQARKEQGFKVRG